jgi:hypothetical protein
MPHQPFRATITRNGENVPATPGAYAHNPPSTTRRSSFLRALRVLCGEFPAVAALYAAKAGQLKFL